MFGVGILVELLSVKTFERLTLPCWALRTPESEMSIQGGRFGTKEHRAARGAIIQLIFDSFSPSNLTSATVSTTSVNVILLHSSR